MKGRASVLVLPALYLCLCVGVSVLSLEGSWGWFVPFLTAFPFSVVLLPALNVLPPLVVFGVFGTLWWCLLSWLILLLSRRAMRFFRGSRSSGARSD